MYTHKKELIHCITFFCMKKSNTNWLDFPPIQKYYILIQNVLNFVNFEKNSNFYKTVNFKLEINIFVLKC